MKGQQCSWRDMRKIKHILANMDKLKGEYEALMRCSAKSTRSQWRDIIEVMNEVPISEPQNILPSHCQEIARLAPRGEWPKWVASCDKEKLTVFQLRSQLLARKSKKATEKAETSTPDGHYRTIVVDPPWSYENRSGRQKQDYADRTMSLEEVSKFDIERWVTADGCHLYLWVTDAYLGNVYSIVETWGFVPKVSLIWVKDRIGMGNYYRHQHEVCIFAVKGNMRLKRMDLSTVFNAPVTRHSEKPDAFYSLVENASPGPYIDVFARKRRAGWDAFGDELESEYQMRLDGTTESKKIEDAL